MSSAVAALSTKDLTKRYGRDAVALSGVNLEIQLGERVSLVGPNGAGKSTLLRTWMGFERPSNGRVAVFAADPRHERSAAVAQIAYVGQEAPMIGRLSAIDHLRVAGSFRRRTDVEWGRTRLSELGVSERRPVQRLSGGQRAQVALTVALAVGAPIILLDEPLANLDPLSRRQFMAEALSRARATNSTLVLASHAVSDIDPTSGRLVVLGRGKILLDMPTMEARSTHRATAILEPPDTNALVGTYLSHDGEQRHLLRLEYPSETPAALEDVVLGYLARAARAA